MATKFRISEEVLAFMLDLPQGARLGMAERIPTADGKAMFSFTVTDVDWPDGEVELVYDMNEDGTASLCGVKPLEETH